MKYPNPFSSHVLAADILSRHIDPVTENLHTTRIMLKTGSMPGWMYSLLKSQDAYVIEESVVDPKRSFMQTKTRNLTHQRFLVVEEIQTYTKSPEDLNWTLAHCHATVKSNFRGSKWTGIGSNLEGIGVKRFKDHLVKSKMAMTWILDKLRNREKEKVI